MGELVGDNFGFPLDEISKNQKVTIKESVLFFCIFMEIWLIFHNIEANIPEILRLITSIKLLNFFGAQDMDELIQKSEEGFVILISRFGVTDGGVDSLKK